MSCKIWSLKISDSTLPGATTQSQRFKKYSFQNLQNVGLTGGQVATPAGLISKSVTRIVATTQVSHHTPQ